MLNDSRETVERAPDAPRYQPLVVVLVAVCAGILADRLLSWALAAWWLGAVVAWVAWWLSWRARRDRAGAAVLLLAVACCGGAWHHCCWCLFDVDDLGHFTRLESQPACVEAVVVRGPWRLPAPERDPMRAVSLGDRTRLEVRLAAVRDGSRWRQATGHARLNVNGQLLGVHAGDRLRIFSQLGAPQPPRNPGEFNYDAYARSDRRRSHLYADYPACVTSMPTATGWCGPGYWLEAIRAASDRMLWRYLDHDRAGLAAAVLLGAREELSEDQSQAFMETGTVHLLAISGLHIGIVAVGLLFGMRLVGVPRNRALAVVVAVVVLYTLLTDARPPAIRATILVIVFSMGQWLGRGRLPFNSLAAAGLVVLVLDPTDLFHAGVHLSFLAVLGLMWFAPGWFDGFRAEGTQLESLTLENRRYLVRLLWPAWRSLRHLTLVSMTIWLLTMPLVMARFHLFTPIAVPLNTLLWIPMTVALACGFGVLVFGWLVPPLATVFGLGCDGSLWLLEWCIGAGRAMPASHHWVPGPANWWLAGFYGILALWVAFPAVRPPRRWCLAIVAGWVGFGFVVPLATRDRAELDCTFLSVQHGLAVVLELPSGATILYDAGQFASPGYGARSIAGCLWSRGVTHLDAIVLTHSDLDHYNTIPELLRRFSVGVIYVSPVMFEEENEAMTALAEAIRAADVPIETISAGDRLLDSEGCTIKVFHPPGRSMLANDNANCVVLAVEYLDRRILLPGDLESPGLDALLAEMPWDCDVLLAPHHGSRKSDPPGLAAWCEPESVVISGGHHSDVEITIAAYQEAGAQILHTRTHGAIHVRVDDTGLELSGFRNPRPAAQ